MSDTVHQIPLDAIDDTALPRDRSVLTGAALTELRLSIAAHGLRMPVEVYRLPHDPDRYGLISGYRRLHAFRALSDLTGQDRYATIPAFLRTPGTLAQALTAVVEENEIRESLSSWERGRIAFLARERGIFPTIEEAVATLYPSADRMKRSRLRALAHLVEELDDLLTEPERLSFRQCMRLSNAIRDGFGPVIRTALTEAARDDPETQWQLILPILSEAERPPAAEPAPTLPGRPRRVLKPKPGLTIRREQTAEGYTLHFTGRIATSGFLDTVLDEIERMFGPG